MKIVETGLFVGQLTALLSVQQQGQNTER